MKVRIISLLFLLIHLRGMAANPVAYDMDMAKEICAALPLDNVEGIWVYPDDKVTVLILNDNSGNSAFPVYNISVVETSDARLHPGDNLGKLESTAQDGIYKIELATERRNELLLKPKTVLANLSKEGDAFIFKRQKSPFRLRLNLNFSRLLPGFWKMISTGISSSGSSQTMQAPVGMIKIYPSYDGNGSSRRKPRYL